MPNVSLVDGHIDEPKAITNYDRIRNMSIEEMAEYLSVNKYPNLPHSPCYVCQYDYGMICGKKDGCSNEYRANMYKKWLESEVTDNDNT